MSYCLRIIKPKLRIRSYMWTEQILALRQLNKKVPRRGKKGQPISLHFRPQLVSGMTTPKIIS